MNELICSGKNAYYVSENGDGTYSTYILSEGKSKLIFENCLRDETIEQTILNNK